MCLPPRRILIHLFSLLFVCVVCMSHVLIGYENPQSPASTAQAVHVAMRNVEYHYTPDTSVRIRFLHGAAAGAYYPAANGLLAHITAPKDRGRSFRSPGSPSAAWKPLCSSCLAP